MIRHPSLSATDAQSSIPEIAGCALSAESLVIWPGPVIQPEVPTIPELAQHATDVESQGTSGEIVPMKGTEEAGGEQW